MSQTHRFAIVFIASLCLCFAWTAPAGAEDDPDYKVQGEYTGKLGDKKIGVQVIARGDGNFVAYSYPGGLPGDGWDKPKNPRSKEASGKTADGVTTIKGLLGGTASIKDGVMTIADGDKALGKLKHIVRKSPTLGKKAPEGAVVLFDGTKKSLENWTRNRGKKQQGEMTAEGHLKFGTTSKPEFQSARVHLEFRTPWTPKARGQGRGNSGIYVQGRYEVQILDSFGLEGKMHEAGGIYSIKPPLFNMAFPPLSWQTYDIEFKAAKFDDTGKRSQDAVMSVWHNGVLVQKDTGIFRKQTTAAPQSESPNPGPIYLQAHGGKVAYRNLWVVPAKE